MNSLGGWRIWRRGFQCGLFPDRRSSLRRTPRSWNTASHSHNAAEASLEPGYRDTGGAIWPTLRSIFARTGPASEPDQLFVPFFTTKPVSGIAWRSAANRGSAWRIVDSANRSGRVVSAFAAAEIAVSCCHPEAGEARRGILAVVELLARDFRRLHRLRVIFA